MEQYFVRIGPDIIAVVILTFILYLLHSDRMVGKRQARDLSFVAHLIFFIVALEAFTVYMEDYKTPALFTIYKISNVLGFSLTPVICIVFSVIYVPSLRNHLIRIIFPIIILFGLCVSSIWTGLIFSVDSNGHYARGPLFLIVILINLYSLGIYFISLRVKGRSYDKVEQINLLGQFCIILFGDFIQIIFPKLLMIWPCFSLVLLLYYNFLKDLSFKYDSLTEVKNRRCFDESFEYAKESENLYIVMFDINNLKSVNDQFGHAKGDEYIQQVASEIKRDTLSGGVLYRIGGDEFCCLCENIQENDLEQMLASVVNGVSKLSFFKDSAQFDWEPLAYGYSHYRKGNGISIEECFKAADKSMYLRKMSQKLKEIE